jgi:hypothetical protein
VSSEPGKAEATSYIPFCTQKKVLRNTFELNTGLILGLQIERLTESVSWIVNQATSERVSQLVQNSLRLYLFLVRTIGLELINLAFGKQVWVWAAFLTYQPACDPAMGALTGIRGLGAP